MFIFSNLATSIDGKIATHSRVNFLLGTPEDHRMMSVLRAKADAVIMGASTLRAFKGPVLVQGFQKSSKKNSKIQPINIVLSGTLAGISPRWKFFTEPSTRKILFVGPDAPEVSIRDFEKVSVVCRLKKSNAPMSLQIVRHLKKLGVKKLLVEGGGGLMWDFVKLNLIDEYHVTLTPRVIGGTHAPTLVDGVGFTPHGVVNLKLKSVRKVGNELFLVYAKRTHRGR
jgi:5-amino-6-(5-phosphoribosylamino)uracil reductase